MRSRPRPQPDGRSSWPWRIVLGPAVPFALPPTLSFPPPLPLPLVLLVFLVACGPSSNPHEGRGVKARVEVDASDDGSELDRGIDMDSGTEMDRGDSFAEDAVERTRLDAASGDTGRRDAGSEDVHSPDSALTDGAPGDASLADGTVTDGPLTDAHGEEPHTYPDLPEWPDDSDDAGCVPPTDHVRSSRPISVGGQSAWEHDEGHDYGFFHTFDTLVACPGATPRKIHVLLPREYWDSSRDHPVLYMNDGQTAFFTDNSVQKTWDVAGVLSRLGRCGMVDDLIVVAPHPLDRNTEYTHEAWMPGRACCGLEAYTNYLTECLRPFIEQHYRARPSREHRAILGSSHGGLAAFWIAAARPDLFAKVAAVSPSFWVGIDDRATGAVGGPIDGTRLFGHARAGLARAAERPAVWIDWGMVREGGDHNRIIEALATERGREVARLLEADLGYAYGSELVAFEDQDGEHDENTWRRRLPWILRWMFAAENKR